MAKATGRVDVATKLEAEIVKEAVQWEWSISIEPRDSWYTLTDLLPTEF